MNDRLSNEDFNGDLKEVLDELFRIKESNVACAVFLVSILVIASIHVLDWRQNYYDDAIDAKTAKDWSIEFDIVTLSEEHIEVWQDEEVKVIDFSMDDFSLPDDRYVGAIFVTIMPEAGGSSATDPLVQCDAIAADIQVNDLTAQWNYDGNNLTGQDSSCENIYLHLQVYPDFTGSNQSSDAPNEYQALMPWVLDGWGDGILEIKVELDVNSVDQLGPVSQDEDEEITIIVEIHTFKAIAIVNG